jgi:hypothetical protein
MNFKVLIRRIRGKPRVIAVAHNVTATSETGVTLKTKVSMGVVVNRFQGMYECGCPALPLDGPEMCDKHNLPRLYKHENLGTATTKIEGS